MRSRKTRLYPFMLFDYEARRIEDRHFLLNRRALFRQMMCVVLWYMCEYNVVECGETIINKDLTAEPAE